MIETIEEAINIIDKQTKGIPYEAIDFLRNHETNNIIKEKILFALKNAYIGEVYYSDKLNLMLPTPLWYAVVAEKHLSEELFEYVLELFTVEEDWDLMNEQAVYLVGLLAKTYPESFTDKVLEFISKSIDQQDNKKPYLYSFEALYFSPKSKHSEILSLLEKEDFHWIDQYVRILADLDIDGVIDAFKVIIPKYKDKHAAVELQYYIDIAEGREKQIEKGLAFCDLREEDWKKHYFNFEPIFDSIKAPILSQINDKVGRNDKCPCGSNKKYKNCCLKN